MGKNEGEKKKNKAQTNLITIYVYNKKQLAQAQSMGGYFCSAYKKKKPEAEITNCVLPQPDS